MGALERALRDVRTRGGKAFVPYVTGGFPGVDPDLLRGLASSGADAIEVGIPHSDPIIDGGVIQRASADALAAGATPAGVLETIASAALEIPVAVMTYINPVLRRGSDAFLDDLARAGVAGAIVPDAPVDEASPFVEAARARELDAVLLGLSGRGDKDLAAIETRLGMGGEGSR